MKQFGTVQSFNADKGRGKIKPEDGGEAIRFESSAFSWGKDEVPTVGQRLSYEVGSISQPCALNLQTI